MQRLSDHTRDELPSFDLLHFVVLDKVSLLLVDFDQFCIVIIKTLKVISQMLFI